MTVYIGNAVGDENGKARGGEAGDQTGREVKIQPWYLNKKGWRVFRPKSAETAQKLVYDMEAACENTNIGYDQGQRNTLYNVSKQYGFDCAKVDEPCECDCSSLVRVCILYAGIKINDFNTASEPARLLATGEFEELTDPKYTDSPDYLTAGMVLCTATKGHTAIVLTNGSKAENDEPSHEPTPEPEPSPEPSPKPVEPSYNVVVIGGSVYVRDKDSKAGKIMFTAHKKNRFPLIDIAPSGWYHIETYKGEAYISNKADLTCLLTV